VDPSLDMVNSTLFCNRAAASMKLNNYEEALQDADRVIVLRDDWMKAYRRRGSIHMELHNYEEAVRDFEKAYQLDKSDPEIKHLVKDAQLQLKKSKRKDYYKILEISPESGENDIRKAYRKLALKYHPDKHQESEESRLAAENTFKDISEAYSVLSDPKKKQRYDSGADLEDLAGPGEMHVNVNEIFQQFFGGSPFGGGGASFRTSFH